MRAVGSGSRATRNIVVIGLVFLVAACSLENSGPAMATREDCQELHAVEAKLTVEAGAPADRNLRIAAELARHQKSLAATGGEESLQRCMSDRTSASIDCARQASSLAELGLCSRQ